MRGMKARTSPVVMIVLVFFVIVSFLPFLIMFLMSSKENVEVLTDFWALPQRFVWQNYTSGFTLIFRPILNSIYVSVVSVLVVIATSSLAGYSFGRYKFRGKALLYGLTLGVIMIPSVMNIVPLFIIASRMKILGSYACLYLVYAAFQQVFGILILRSFYSTLPNELFEAARVEGASETYTFWKIAFPLSASLLIAIALTVLVAVYNEYIWATLTLGSTDVRKTFSQAVVLLATGGSSEYGRTAAAYVIGSIPLVAITGSCMKYYIQGALAGAIKG